MDIQTIVGWFKDILFPVFCLNCDQEGKVLCQSCIKTLKSNREYFCPVCHLKRSQRVPCDSCRTKTFLDSHVAIFPYREGEILSQLIHEWKYNWVEDCEEIFRIFCEQYFHNHQLNFVKKIDLIVPVPLHKKRYAERGFNQAERLAKILENILQKSVHDILLRTKYTEQQAKLGKVERQKNVSEAFSLQKNTGLSGKNILLVDDVLTTSATLNECAKILKQAGAGEVHAFTLARG